MYARARVLAAVLAVLACTKTAAGHDSPLRPPAPRERRAAAAEGALLAQVRAIADPAAAPALIDRIRDTGAVIPRLRDALVHLAVERALDLSRDEAPPQFPSPLPAPTQAMLRAATGGESIPGLPPALEAPLREAAGAERANSVVLFVVDGLRRDILDAALAAGKLPNLRTHLLARGLTVDRMVSVFPSVTPPNAATLLTGVLPDRHRIPALAWYDPAAGTARLYTSVRGRDINRDLSVRERTLWERLRERFEVATVGMPLERGAWTRWFHLFYPDAAIARVGNAYLGRAGYLPTVLGMWFLDLDSASHLGGTFSKGAQAALERLDQELGRVVETLKSRGAYERTLLVWVSDHGSQPTLKNVDIVGELATAGLPCRTLDLSVDPFFPSAMGRRLKDAPAVAINLGAGSASLYLRAAKDAPDVEAVLKRYPAAGGGTLDVLGTLLAQPSVDVAMYTVGKGAYRVVSRAGRAEIAASSRDGGPRDHVRYTYRVLEGADPLGVPLALHDRALPLADWISATAAGERPGAVPGIATFLGSGRAGDVAFTARPGFNFSKHFHTRGGYHGGLSAGEMVTRMVMAGPGVPHARVASASMADVTPTILALLGVPHDPREMDGRSLVTRDSAPIAVANAPIGAGIALPVAPKPGPSRRGNASEDRARLGAAIDPQLSVHQLYRVPDWRLGASGDTAPWWPLLLPLAFPGSALQVDFRRPAGDADVVVSPGVVRTSHDSVPGDRLWPTLDLRTAMPLSAGARSWIGLSGGAGALAGPGGRMRGRTDAGLLVTHSVSRSLRGFAFAGGYAGSALGDDRAAGMRWKGGLELFLGDRGTAVVEAVKEERPGGDVSSIGGVVNVASF